MLHLDFLSLRLMSFFYSSIEVDTTLHVVAMSPYASLSCDSFWDFLVLTTLTVWGSTVRYLVDYSPSIYYFIWPSLVLVIAYGLRSLWHVGS